jgi:DNA (cytosine-5)-methyltransferase 1
MGQRRVRNNPISVIDLFAGPGGLSEGFDQYRRRSTTKRFRIRLSIEKDSFAHSTLLLRSFYRQFSPGRIPDKYYTYLRGEIERHILFDAFPDEAAKARQEVWNATLGGPGLKHTLVRDRIRSALNGAENWVLLGGPPCQAYSLVGRSRMRSTDADVDAYETDHRHFLYKEYLRIIADHRPPVFVLENVKGLLSSIVRGEHTFQRILEDLANPTSVFPNGGPDRLKYRLFPLSHADDRFGEFREQDYVIHAEDYGIPQARHRIFVLGLRSDLFANSSPKSLENSRDPVPLGKVIHDIPALRSGISKVGRNTGDWFEWVESAAFAKWLHDPIVTSATRDEIIRTVFALDLSLNTGDVFVSKGKKKIRFADTWFTDERLGGYCNHQARSHMPSDLHRYLFAAAFSKAHAKSPKLSDFPSALLPAHKNVQKDVAETIFSDRFRVQLAFRQATTITAHISKDGHYFIHPDPSQCRSLTVREAARIQTFPDNYFFEGPRTEQYRQVGNAVPPLLALQVAKIVSNLFDG